MRLGVDFIFFEAGACAPEGCLAEEKTKDDEH